MEEEEESKSPFWLQTPRRQRRRSSSSSSSSVIFNFGVLVVILLIIAVAFIFFIIPSFLSPISQIFRPNSVKKSWDSLNLVLVVFAIVCGFLSRNTGNNGSSESTATTRSAYEEDHKFENRSKRFQKSNPETPRRLWYDHHHPYNNRNDATTLNTLRSFSSYPDLRLEEASWTSRDDQWRFYDDTSLYNYRSSSFRQPQQKLHTEYSSGVDGLQNYPWLRPPQQKVEVEEKENENMKSIDAAKEEEESRKAVVYTPSPPETLPSPPPRQPEAKVVSRKVRRTCQDLGKKEKYGHQNDNVTHRREVSPPAPPSRHAPPPPPLSVFEEGGKNEKKRGGTSSTKEFLTSLRRKKKKQRQKSVENLDSFFNYESSYPLPSIPPPPPPPPPFFHNLLSSKKHKAKKIDSVIPTPPPPPPPRTQKLSVSASESKVESKNISFTAQKPLLLVNANNVVEENANSGNESPMNSIPPPPPPFKMPAWKFEVHGDFVRLKSTIGEDVEESSSPSVSGSVPAADGGDGALTPLFCPSPDVNTKADNFIARFRAGLNLEKMNSVKEKEERRRSNLGPEPSPE